MQRRPGRGFSLMEIMVAAAILAIVLATLAPRLRQEPVSTHGAALALAAALTEARQQAVAQGVPVALVIPSGNGSQGPASSYYIASGEQPRVLRVRRLDGDHPGVRLMVGVWGLDATRLANPALTTTITPPPESTWETDLRAQDWKAPQPADFAFIFTPRGRLVTNDLPHFDGAYHLVVSQGGRRSPTSVPGAPVTAQPPALFRLDAAGSPVTVTIDLTGAVRVTTGIEGMVDGAVALSESAPSDPPPEPPAPAPRATSAPLVSEVTLLPDPANLSLPSGVGLLLAPNRLLTVTVRASSPEREPLFCQWEATGGGLSSSESIRMSYLPESEQWESAWEWRLPADAVPNSTYELSGTVADAHGNQTIVGFGAAAEPLVVKVGDPSTRVAWQGARDGEDALQMINADGSGQVVVTKADDHQFTTEPAWSPDGQRLLFRGMIDGGSQTYLVNPDGTGKTNLSGGAYSDGDAVWSPDGGRIAFWSNRSGDLEIWVMNADGSEKMNLTNSDGSDSNPTWSPDGSRIAFHSHRDGNAEIYVMDADGTDQTNLTNDPASDTIPLWSPVEDRILFTSHRDGDTEIYSMNSAGADLRNLTSSAGTDHWVVWSHDGNRIAFISHRLGPSEMFLMNKDGTGVVNLSNHPSSDGYPSWSEGGNRLSFWSDRDGSQEIYVVNDDGSGANNVSRYSGPDSHPSMR